mmetsp:Transcript_122218/g.353378  ORF Transcript_122218/g.353378 Transcript_122218/m.353378 type:complete len:155 (-) Transcript_122218:10-474(-)
MLCTCCKIEAADGGPLQVQVQQPAASDAEDLLNKPAQPSEEPHGGLRPGAALETTFEHQGQIFKRTFVKKPIGFKFRLRPPMYVISVNPRSHAEELGIKVGMQLVAIGDTPTADLNPVQALKMLKDACEGLEPDEIKDNGQTGTSVPVSVTARG